MKVRRILQPGKPGTKKLVKRYGRKWDPQRKLWTISYEKIKELDLLERIVDDKST